MGIINRVTKATPVVTSLEIKLTQVFLGECFESVGRAPLNTVSTSVDVGGAECLATVAVGMSHKRPGRCTKRTDNTLSSS